MFNVLAQRRPKTVCWSGGLDLSPPSLCARERLKYLLRYVLGMIRIEAKPSVNVATSARLNPAPLIRVKIPSADL